MHEFDLWFFDKNRLMILSELLSCKENELGGCDIRNTLSLKKPLLNYHINILKNKGVIVEKSVGRDKYYQIPERIKPKVKQALEAVLLFQ